MHAIPRSILAMSLLMSAAGPATADAHADCNNSADPKAQISGCTAMLGTSAIPHDNAITYYLRANAYYTLQDMGNALKDYSQSIQLDPSAPACQGRGNVEITTGELDTAVADFTHALDLEPEMADAFALRALAKNRLGDIPAAMVDIQKAFDIGWTTKSQAADWYGIAGNIRMAQRNFPKAINNFEHALENAPNSPSLLNELAWAQMVSDNTADALPNIQAALSAAPDDPTFIDTQAHVLMKLGQADNAHDAFLRAMKLGRSDIVKGYQTGLASLNFFHGEANGVFGDDSDRALRACIAVKCRLQE